MKKVLSSPLFYHISHYNNCYYFEWLLACGHSVGISVAVCLYDGFTLIEFDLNAIFTFLLFLIL